MKIKTSELTGALLDWAMAKCEGREAHMRIDEQGELYASDQEYFDYSTDWSQGGPIIEREKIELAYTPAGWRAQQVDHPPYGTAYGPTPLIAAMRCIVASKLGDEVDVPEELL